MATDKHPFLCVLQAYLTSALPDPQWRESDVVAIGVATPLEPQWLTVRFGADAVLAGFEGAPPPSPRAVLVLDATTAQAALGTEPLPRDAEIHATGDVAFLRRVLTGSVLAGHWSQVRSQGGA